MILAGARLKASMWFSLLRGMYQGGTCKGRDRLHDQIKISKHKRLDGLKFSKKMVMQLNAGDCALSCKVINQLKMVMHNKLLCRHV